MNPPDIKDLQFGLCFYGAVMSHLWLLSEFIHEKKEEIVQEWIELSNERYPFMVIKSLSYSDFRDHIPEILETLSEVLQQQNGHQLSPASYEAVRKHGYERWKQGFSLPQLLLDWGNLQEIVSVKAASYLREAGDKLPPKNKAEITGKITRFFTEAMCASAQRFDEARQNDASSVSSKLVEIKTHFEKLYNTHSGFLRQASHDMRGELMAIACASNILKGNDLKKNPNPSNLGSLIDNSVSSVMEILDSLLNLSRLEVGDEKVEIKNFDASDMLRGLCQNFQQAAEAKGLELKIDGPASMQVVGDPVKTRRIAQNLLINAIKYTQKGFVSISWGSEAEYWELKISDTGPGLRSQPSEVVKNVTKPAQKITSSENPTRVGIMDYKGDGIGLIIVKRLCTLLKATIHLTSNEHSGTTFHILFPKN